MKIAILGYGKEGQAAEKYFLRHNSDAEIKVYQDFTAEEIAKEDFSEYDLVLRSPSVRPMPGVTSMTRYFFESAPAQIIGVTGTKGKGTTCSLIRAIFEAMGRKVYLVGNIGVPAIEVLDGLKPDDVVVYEMSSFQLWDLENSPHVAVVLGIEPDHLNVHRDFEEYVEAKANIAHYQTIEDYCIYNRNNEFSRQIAEISEGTLIPYPIDDARLDVALEHLAIVGRHNRENAMAAVAAVAAYLNLEVDELLERHFTEICRGLESFNGLPHRLEFLREINGVKYYDDNFSTNPASIKVAIEAFPDEKIVLIAGGRDKTDNADIEEIYELLQSENIAKVVLMGESGHEIYRRHRDEKFVLVESLEEAVRSAQQSSEKTGAGVILMSPAAASFDMFENVYDRGAKFQEIIAKL